jgi:hypothetical protein
MRLLPRPVARGLATVSDSPLGWVVLGAAALIVMGVVQLLPEATIAIIKPKGASLALCVWILTWGVLLAVNWRHWLVMVPTPRRTFAAGHAVFAVALVLILVNAASPYLGLKTRFSFTMFSNLQTEPGRWNHVVIPEAVRIFDTQRGLVEFGDVSDPVLAKEIAEYSGPDRWSSGAEHSDTARMPVLMAQAIVSDFPNATVSYELDGQPHVAAPVASDPILGTNIPLIIRKIGGYRPLDVEDSCQL